jgi:hypothetical protein
MPYVSVFSYDYVPEALCHTVYLIKARLETCR